MKEIQITQDQVALVDDGDYARFNQDPWCAHWNSCTQSFYAKRAMRRDGGGGQITLLLHREIMGIEPGDPREVHHVNGNTLDNRRENLKVVTRLEHQGLHRNDPRKDASPYGIGVQRQKNGRFEAQAQIAGKKHYLGMHDTAEEAQEARVAFLKEYAA